MQDPLIFFAFIIVCYLIVVFVVPALVSLVSQILGFAFILFILISPFLLYRLNKERKWKNVNPKIRSEYEEIVQLTKSRNRYAYLTMVEELLSRVLLQTGRCNKAIENVKQLSDELNRLEGELSGMKMKSEKLSKMKGYVSQYRDKIRVNQEYISKHNAEMEEVVLCLFDLRTQLKLIREDEEPESIVEISRKIKDIGYLQDVDTVLDFNNR